MLIAIWSSLFTTVLDATSSEYLRLVTTSPLGCFCISAAGSQSQQAQHFSRTTGRTNSVMFFDFVFFQTNFWRVKLHFTLIAWQLSGCITWDGMRLHTCFVNKKIEIPRKSSVFGFLSNHCSIVQCFFPLKCKIWKLLLLSLIWKGNEFPQYI